MGACRALQQPRLDVAVRDQGGTREEWAKVFDLANYVRHDDATLRAVANIELAERMSRRFPRLGRRPVRGAAQTKSAAAQFRGLYQAKIGGVDGESDFWFDGSGATIDGVSGKTQSLVDYLDPTHTFSQPSSGLQSDPAAANAALANAKTLTFTGAQQYDSNRAAARGRFLHAGSGMTLLASMRVPAPAATQVWISTGNSSAVASFEGIFLNGTNTLRMGFGATLGNQSAGTFTNGESFYVDIAHASPAYALRKRGTSTTSGSFAATSAVDPPSPLRIGARVDGTFRAILDLRGLYGFHRSFNTAERTVAQAFIKYDTGMAA